MQWGGSCTWLVSRWLTLIDHILKYTSDFILCNSHYVSYLCLSVMNMFSHLVRYFTTPSITTSSYGEPQPVPELLLPPGTPLGSTAPLLAVNQKTAAIPSLIPTSGGAAMVGVGSRAKSSPLSHVTHTSYC